MPSQSLNTHTHTHTRMHTRTHAHTHTHTLHGLEANKDNKQNKIQPRIMAKQITMKMGQLNEERDQINERELSCHCFFFASFEVVPSERGGGGGGKLGTKKPSRGSNTTINCIASSL